MNAVLQRHNPMSQPGHHPSQPSLADARHRRVLVLTGAGLSTASGIPDYRDKDGVRREYATAELTKAGVSDVDTGDLLGNDLLSSATAEFIEAVADATIIGRLQGLRR